MNHRYVPGVRYIAGVTFQSEYGVHEAGSDVPEAPGFWNLDSLVDNRFLWPYAPDQGYDWLPPHLFNAVKTRDEVLANLTGDPHGTRPVEQWPDGEVPDMVKKAELEAEQQLVIREKIKATDQPGDKPVAVKRAAKKTAEPVPSDKE